MNVIILEGKGPTDGSNSINVSFFKGKVDVLDRSNHRGLKLIDHVLKVIERVIETSYVTQLTLMKCRLAFAPVQIQQNPIFLLGQLQKQYLAKHRKLYMAFVDLEKVFDRVPRKVLW